MTWTAKQRIDRLEEQVVILTDFIRRAGFSSVPKFDPVTDDPEHHVAEQISKATRQRMDKELLPIRGLFYNSIHMTPSGHERAILNKGFRILAKNSAGGVDHDVHIRFDPVVGYIIDRHNIGCLLNLLNEIQNKELEIL